MDMLSAAPPQGSPVQLLKCTTQNRSSADKQHQNNMPYKFIKTNSSWSQVEFKHVNHGEEAPLCRWPWTDMFWVVAHNNCRKWLPSSLDIPTFRCLRNGRQVDCVYTYKIATFLNKTSPFHNCTYCKFALEPCGQGILYFCRDHSLFSFFSFWSFDTEPNK
jgi:hypothetical protein